MQPSVGGKAVPMSKVRGSKRQLEKARQEKAAAKRDKRDARRNADPAVPDPDAPQFDQADVLADLADLHRRYDDEAISLDEFEQARDELLQRLRVE
jgi:uncharacterized membrane protein